jgi:hypothetical protein
MRVFHMLAAQSRVFGLFQQGFDAC